MLGLELLDARKRHPKRREKGLQRGEFLCGRLVMHAVQRRELLATEEARGGYVRRDHAFLDHPMCIVALVGADRFDPAILAEFDERLWHFEIDGAPLAPLREKRAEYGLELLEVRHEAGVLPAEPPLLRQDERGDVGGAV